MTQDFDCDKCGEDMVTLIEQEKRLKAIELQKAYPSFLRFNSILKKGLRVGLETNIYAQVFSKVNLPPEFQIKHGGDRAYVRHPATDNGTNLLRDLLLNPKNAKPLVLTFQSLPSETKILFQRLNLRQSPNPEVPGITLGRFTAILDRPETAPFTIMKNPNEEGYINLDCLSRSPVWNPLFVKYHLAVVPSLKENEYGYIKIDVHRNENQEIVVTVSRASESDVPEFLKTAQTYPG